MNRYITSTSIIKGVFNEISILGLTIRVTANGSIYYTTIHNTTNQSRGHPSNNESISFRDLNIEDKDINLVFELDRAQFQCDLYRNGSTNPVTYAFPEKLIVSQKRSYRRIQSINFSKDPSFAEIRGISWILFGHVNNVDLLHINIGIHSSEFKPKLGEVVYCRIYTQYSEILSRSATIIFTRYTTHNRFEIVLKLHESKRITDQKQERLPRIKFDELHLTNCYWPDLNGVKIKLQLVNVGIFGICGVVLNPESDLPPLGSVCLFTPHNLSGRLVWCDFNFVGFDLRTNSQRQLNKWYNSIKELSHNALLRLPEAQQRKRLLTIFLRSGYLQGSKAKLFSEIPKLDTLIPNSPSSRLWLRRYSKSFQNRDAEAHVSFSRVTDSSWMLQEVASCAPGIKAGKDLISQAILDFHYKETPYASLNSVLLVTYDPSIKFNQNLWEQQKSNSISFIFRSILVNISSVIHSSSSYKDSDLNFAQPSRKSWKSNFGSLLTIFPELLLTSVGITQFDYRSPELNLLLGYSGYQLDRKLLIILEKGSIVGLIISFGLPFHSNLNATNNRIWILLKHHSLLSRIFSQLMEYDISRELLFGSTEALVVALNCPERLDGIELPKGAKLTLRSLLITPIISLDQFFNSLIQEKD